ALDAPALRHSVGAAVRALREAHVPVWGRIAPDLEAVKAARAAEVDGIEFSTVGIVDLPDGERALALERLADAARLAAKLRLPCTAGGALDAPRVRALVAAVPGLAGIAVGRELAARALLVGMERAVASLREALASRPLSVPTGPRARRSPRRRAVARRRVHAPRLAR